MKGHSCPLQVVKLQFKLPKKWKIHKLDNYSLFKIIVNALLDYTASEMTYIVNFLRLASLSVLKYTRNAK